MDGPNSSQGKKARNSYGCKKYIYMVDECRLILFSYAAPCQFETPKKKKEEDKEKRERMMAAETHSLFFFNPSFSQ